MTTPVNPKAMSKHVEDLEAMIETNPLGAVQKLNSKINEILTDLEKNKDKAGFQMQAERADTTLKQTINWGIELIEMCLFAHTEDKGGFPVDPTGLLVGKTLWGTSPKMQKRFPKTHMLVDQYAKECIQEKLKGSKGDNPDEFMSSSAAAQILNSQEDVVTTQLTDGSEITFDKKENLIGVKDKETGEISWFRSKYNLAKEWASSVMQYLKEQGIRLWNWMKARYESCVNFIFGSDDKKESTK